MKINWADGVQLGLKLIPLALQTKVNGRISDRLTLYTLLREMAKVMERDDATLSEKAGYQLGIDQIDSDQFKSFQQATSFDPGSFKELL